MAKLFIVATPIGNLKDITLRAIETLREVDFILAEDTRVTKKLLSHLDIHKTVISFHEHSKNKAFEKILGLLKENKNLALVTDAGTPGISDPGQRLINTVIARSVFEPKSVLGGGRTERGGASLQGFRSNEKPGSSKQYGLGDKVEIIPIPGPSAISAITSVSDIDLSEFSFLGFPPHKKGRQTFFKRVAASEVPVILFESPHRIQKTLRELAAAAGDRHCNVGRELTKMYEEIFRGKLSEAEKHFVGEKQRGEFVLVVDIK